MSFWQNEVALKATITSTLFWEVEMLRKVFIVLLTLLVSSSMLYAATTGKIAGVVKDKETGEPLPGANVIVVGTTLGAATDVNGQYVILNVPVGTYSVKAGFIGYRDVTIHNIRVSLDLTTEANFDLPTEAIELGSVEIVAERPLVNKNATNEVHIVSGEQIKKLPLRGYENVAALSGAVVKVGGTLYVRGGRSDEVAYYIDGVLQNNPLNNGRVGSLANNSIEEVQTQTGGFNAEFGFANSGVIQVTSKTGGPKLNLNGEVISDDWLSRTSKNLGAYSYGYNLYTLSLNGPVPGLKNAKFYLAGERTYMADRDPRAGVHPAGVDEATGNVILTEGPKPSNALSRWNWNGNISLDVRPFQFKIGGNSTRDNWRSYQHAYSLFNSEFNPKSTRDTDSYYLKATHTVNASTFWTATGSWFRTFGESGDYRFFDDVEAYGDTTKNHFLRSPGNNPRLDAAKAYFSPLGTTWGNYSKNETSYLGLKADITHQAGRTHELKAGFDFRRNTVRSYSVGPLRVASARAANPEASDESVYRSAFADNTGYNILGTEKVDEGINKARHPLIGAAYVQDKLEFSDLVLNLGLRWDYFDTDEPTFADPSNIILNADGNIDPAQLRDPETYSVLSPRIGMSFPVTDQTVFHAQWGKFIQSPRLDRLFIGYTGFANRLQAGNFVTLNNPLLKPIKTTAFEVGFRQQLGNNAALNITAYYKELRDLIQARNLNINQTTFATFINGDYGTVKGVSMTFELRRTQHVSAFASYTLQFAGGTGSASNDAFAINWLGNPPVYPTFVAPLSFDQRHTGSVNVDFRTVAGEGPRFLGGHPFGRFGANLLFTFGSGRPYTPGQMRSAVFGSGPAAQNRPQAAINSSYTPFTSQLDFKVDKSFEVGGVDFNVYFWAINILNTKNVRSVYEQSGEPNTDGYLESDPGKSDIARLGPNFVSYYDARVNNPNNYDLPRQYRLGLQFNLQ